MALIVLTSAAGSPGVTTAAVGLTLLWRRPTMLVDADPAAGQSVLAGYLRGQIATAKGLQRVAEAHRDGRPLAEMVSDETVPLTDQEPPDRRLLPGFARPAAAGLFGPVWPDLMDALVGYGTVGVDVVIDAGRIPPTGLPKPLLERADLVLLLTRTSLRAVAAVRNHAELLIEQTRVGDTSNVGLALVGEGQPYGRREIAQLLGLSVITAFADDPSSAAVFSDGARRQRRFDRAALPRSLRRAADEIDGRIRRRQTSLGLLESPEDEPVTEDVVPASSGGGVRV